MNETIDIDIDDWRKYLIEKMIRLEAMNTVLLARIALLEGRLAGGTSEKILEEMQNEVFELSKKIAKNG